MREKCLDCGADVLTYHKNGKLASRPYCREHHNAHKKAEYIAKRIAETGMPADWRRVHKPELCPPEGVRRVLVDAQHRRVIFYERQAQKTQSYGKLRHVNTRRLLEFYLDTGYHLVSKERHQFVLDKAIL